MHCPRRFGPDPSPASSSTDSPFLQLLLPGAASASSGAIFHFGKLENPVWWSVRWAVAGVQWPHLTEDHSLCQ